MESDSDFIKKKSKKEKKDKKKEKKSKKHKKKSHSFRRDRSRTPKINKHQEFKYDAPPEEDNIVKQNQRNIGSIDEFIENLNNNQLLSQQQKQTEIIRRTEALRAKMELQTSKSDKKLVLGNIPNNIPPDELKDTLEHALRKMASENQFQDQFKNDNMILDLKIQKMTAFVEFHQFEDCNLAYMLLPQVAIYRQQLKVGRPKQYLDLMMKIEAFLGDKNTTGYKQGQTSFLSMKVKDLNAPVYLLPCRFIVPPTNIIWIRNISTAFELEVKEEYDDIYEDIRFECAKYGEIMQLILPKPSIKYDEIQLSEEDNQKNKTEISKLKMEIYKENFQKEGVERAFIKYETQEMAVKARQALNGVLFGYKMVDVFFMDPIDFENKRFSLQPSEKVD